MRNVKPCCDAARLHAARAVECGEGSAHADDLSIDRGIGQVRLGHERRLQMLIGELPCGFGQLAVGQLHRDAVARLDATSFGERGCYSLSRHGIVCGGGISTRAVVTSSMKAGIIRLRDIGEFQTSSRSARHFSSEALRAVEEYLLHGCSFGSDCHAAIVGATPFGGDSGCVGTDGEQLRRRYIVRRKCGRGEKFPTSARPCAEVDRIKISERFSDQALLALDHARLVANSGEHRYAEEIQLAGLLRFIETRAKIRLSREEIHIASGARVLDLTTIKPSRDPLGLQRTGRICAALIRMLAAEWLSVHRLGNERDELRWIVVRNRRPATEPSPSRLIAVTL